MEFCIPSEKAEALGIARLQSYTSDHCALVHMIGKFAKCATSPTDTEGWIRQHPLWVYIFELIVGDVLEEPDYAPASILVAQDTKSFRVWLNISQEGKALVDELREHGILNGLKLSSTSGQPVTCFQLSVAGLQFNAKIPDEIKLATDRILYPPNSLQTDESLLRVKFDATDYRFRLYNENGFSRDSNITDTEDVSYVSSPYLPSCLRNTTKPMHNNSHRRDESAGTADAIQAETNEVITLGNARTLVCEWVPFGANQIVALNERLGAMDRCQGGFFTNMVDTDPTKTSFDVPPGLTQVSILDFDFIRFINFEAEIGYAVDEGIVQVEEFGMHLNVDGTLIYGMFIEAINERHAESVSVDHLARVLVDVHKDSSEIMGDILSEFQMKLLDMIFMGDAQNRGKFNAILAETLEPLLDGKFFIDRSERELEIKQIIGDVITAKLLRGTDLILVGREGLCYAGPNWKECEQPLISFVSLLSKEKFIRNFFVRMFILNSQIEESNTLIQSFNEDPKRIFVIRERLQRDSQTIILLRQTLDYLLRAVEKPYHQNFVESSIASLFVETTRMKEQYKSILLRTKDMVKLVRGSENKLSIQRQQAASITQRLVAGTVKNIDVNFGSLVSAAAADERSAVANDIMNIIFAGSFCFHIIDRLTGDDFLGFEGVDCGPSVGNGYSWQAQPGEGTGAANWIYIMLGWLIYETPFGWFVFNIVWLLVLSWLLQRFMAALLAKARGAMSIRKRLDLPINIEAFDMLAAQKTVVATGVSRLEDLCVEKIAWNESDSQYWDGEPPTILLEYDRQICFLYQMELQWNGQRQRNSSKTLVSLFVEQLRKEGITD